MTLSTTRYRVVLVVDASAFERAIGDKVEKGETVGHLAGRAVRAPFKAIIENACRETQNQSLVVTLIEDGR